MKLCIEVFEKLNGFSALAFHSVLTFSVLGVAFDKSSASVAGELAYCYLLKLKLRYTEKNVFCTPQYIKV